MLKTKQKFFLFFVVIVSALLAGNFVFAATYFSDDFNVSSYTILSNRAPNTGTSWTRLINNSRDLIIYASSDYVQVDSNGADTGVLYQANGTYSTADYEVSLVNIYSGGSSSGYTKSLAARIQDANNMYLLRFNQTVFKIYKRVGGVWTEIGSQSSVYPQGNTSSSPWRGDTVGLRVVGDQIIGKINGNVVLTVTDSDITAAGTAGVGIGYVNISTDDSGTGVDFDDFSVESVTTNYTLTYTAGANGSISGDTPQTVASGSDGTAVTAVADAGYVFSSWSDSSTDNPRTDTNVTGDVSVSASFVISDTDAPILTLVSAFATEDGAVITWTTDEDSSTQVNYGLTNSYGFSTSETDTSPRVTSHSASLSGLVSCTQYHYQAQSTDAYTNTGTSSDQVFTTTGCTGSASVSVSAQETITTASGGTLTHGDIALAVPVSFTSSTSSVVFQVNQLDNTAFSAVAGTPSGYTQLGTSVYTLKALADAVTSISTFSESIRITLTYSSSDVGTLDESSLWIYRYDGSSWTALDDCAVDASARTVSCTTLNFSDVAIFGEEGVCATVAHATAYNAYPTCGVVTCDEGYVLSNGDCVAPRIGGSYVLKLSNQALINQLKAQMENLRNQIYSLMAESSTLSVYVFTVDLYLGVTGEDVKHLQIYLNNNGFKLTDLGDGSKGNETNFFGQLTKQALIKFQKAKNIFPAVGFFGPVTRGLINRQ